MTLLATPRDWWAKLNEEFNFTIDLAASEKYHMVEPYYTEEMDAFKQDWVGTGWCSPPWSNDSWLDRWCMKAYASVTEGAAEAVVLLLPVRLNASWFKAWSHLAEEVRLLSPLKFERMDSDDDSPIHAEPHCLFIFRKAHADIEPWVGDELYLVDDGDIPNDAIKAEFLSKAIKLEGSLDDYREKVWRAWGDAFPDPPYIPEPPSPPSPELVETYEDYLIVWLDGEYYKVEFDANVDKEIPPQSEWKEAKPKKEWVVKMAAKFDVDAFCSKKAIKIIDDKTRRIAAYATIWGETDCDGERMTKAAIEPYVLSDAVPMMLWLHGLDKEFGGEVIGAWDKKAFRLDALGLWVEGNIADTSIGDKAWKRLKAAGNVGLSVGSIWYLIKRQKAADGVTDIVLWPLLEISAMEGGKQCVPSAMRDLKSNISELLVEHGIKMGVIEPVSNAVSTTRMQALVVLAVAKSKTKYLGA